jgi:hypothetical protein
LPNIKSSSIKPDIYEPIDYFELNEFREQRLLEKEFWELVKDFTSFSLFLIFLFIVAYSNISANSIYSNRLYQNSFAFKQSNVEIGLDSVKLFINIF